MSDENKKADSSQWLDLPPKFCEKPPSDPARMLKESKARIKAAVENYAQLGLWFSRVRRFGLWRYSKRPKFKSFAEFYKHMGYSADQVSHQIAISTVLRMLLEEFGKAEVKVNVYHATILLRGVRDDEARFKADGELACDIFRTVLAAEAKVTGKLLKKEMTARGLLKATPKQKSRHTEEDNESKSDVKIGEPIDGLSLGENAGNDSESNQAVLKTKEVLPRQARKELNEARSVAAALVEDTGNSTEHLELHKKLIQLRTLLEEVYRQVNS